MPVGVRSTSVQPVKRFSWFQVDSPWRIRTSLYMGESLGIRVRKPGILESLVDVRHNSRKPVQFFIDNWMLISVALASGAMLLWPVVQGATSGGLSAAGAVQL